MWVGGVSYVGSGHLGGGGSEIFGVRRFCGYFCGHHKIGLYLGSFLCILGSLFLRSRYRMGDIFWVAKISNIFGVLEIPDIFGVEG